MIWITYIIAGIFTGILSGWVGAGGGIIIIPIMLWVTTIQGIGPALGIHLAVATSLAFIMINSVYTTCHHHRSNNLLLSLFKRIVIFVIIGALIGGQLDNIIPSNWTKIFFIVLMVIIFVQSFFIHINHIGIKPINPKPISLAIMGFIVGLAASIVGIGGSAITNPYMLHHKFPMKKSAAMSTALAIPMGLFAVISILVSSIGMSHLPEYSLGYIYIPAFIGLLFGSFIGSPLGVFIVKRVPDRASVNHSLNGPTCHSFNGAT